MKKTVRSFPADGLRRELPIFHLRFVGAVCGQCAGGAGAFCVHLEDPAGCVERRAGLCAGGEHPPLRLDGSAVCGAGLPHLHCGTDVLPICRRSGWRPICGWRFPEHLATLPLGFTETFGSGKLRKIIHESTGAAETFLAHQLPDKYNAMATPIGLLVLLLVFDWRLGLLSLVPVALGFVIMSAMTGRRMADKMRQYGNALESMSNEAVEYVRGIPVVKTFGQSGIFRSKNSKTTIDEYEKWVISYTKDLRMPMMFYTAAINGVFAFLIVGGLLFTRNGVTSEFLLNLLFYIIITPVIS